MTPWASLLGAALLLAAGSPARADVDVSEYQTRAKPGSEQEQARLKTRIEEEARLEAERAHQEAEEEAKRLAAERARLEARPYPVKLTERRCTLCHNADNYTRNGHTWPGWQAVVLRMQYLNHCPLEPGERAVIVAYLAETHPASTAEALLEWSALAAALLLPLGGAVAFGAWRRRRSLSPTP
ncbi:MAG TPA: hypothetical protein VFP70_00530 [Burkholderiales bacterium]|nr:hypothetical protein [Burkholderiales bacterium]